MYNFLAISATSSVLLVLIFIFISFFCLFLFVENHKLREKLKQLELENKRLLEVKITKQKNIDSVSISKISNIEKKQTNNNQNKKIELVSKQPTKESIKQEIKETKSINLHNQSTKKLYQKNVLHDKPTVTSPVSISKVEDNNFDLNEFIKINELKVENTVDSKDKKNKNFEINKVEPSIEKQPVKIINNKKSNNIEYLQEISNKMADELKPQTIELTDYEKLQEENAIISYKELITLKDKIMMLDDDDETINFIEELKKLRNSLK